MHAQADSGKGIVSNMNDYSLELIDASFSYDGKNNAIDSINVKIRKGEHIAVLGGNGSGKSTFFLCLNGIRSLSSGKILLNGKELRNKKKDSRLLCREAGYVFQDPDHQIIGSTVEGELSFGLMNLNIHPDEIKLRIDEITEKLNLKEFRKRPPYYLSGGEKKRVAIADILLLRPNLLLLDEPAASLDLTHIAAFEKLLQEEEINKLGILISMHDVDFAWRWADRILLFHQGRIIGDDVPEKIFGDDQLIRLAGLRKPLYYSITETLCKELNCSLPDRLPKSMTDFQEFARTLAIHRPY